MNLGRGFAFVALLGWLGITDCAGAPCHSSAGCAGGLECSGPNDGPSCGIAPMQQCKTSADCPQGEVCNAVFEPCSASGVGSACGVPCTACGDGLRCNAAGACETVPCDEGFACPSRQKCDKTAAHTTTPVFAQNHGCVNIQCASDDECPSGKSCVNAFCQDHAGSCKEVMAVP
jgi:hypothetical protein